MKRQDHITRNQLNCLHMKPIKQPFSRTLIGLVISAVFLFSFSCSQESDMYASENLEAIKASANNGKKVKRPWKIRSAGTFEFDPSVSCGEGLTPLKITGGGEASHVGNYQVELEWCFGNTPSITGILTAANGDTILFYAETFNEDGSITYRVDNGTGRFNQAGGLFTLSDTEPTTFTNGPGEPPRGTYANAGEGYLEY